MVRKLRDRLVSYGRVLTRDELLAEASAVDPETFDLEEYCRYEEPRYARNTVLSNDHFELVVICWLPGQATAVHDHGESNCLYLVVGGEMEEEVFLLDEAGEPQPHLVRSWGKGDITISVGTDIHRVRNVAAERLQTVHIYSPPLGAVARTYTPIPTANGG